jgi:hypothetical protein
MKLAICRAFTGLFLTLSFWGTTAFTTLAPDEETRVFIDGKEIYAEGTIQLEKDDTILLEATGLKPNTDIYIKVKKAGIKWAEDTYRVGAEGKVKEILDVPEKDLIVNCTVTYTNASGNDLTTEFKLKIR